MKLNKIKSREKKTKKFPLTEIKNIPCYIKIITHKVFHVDFQKSGSNPLPHGRKKQEVTQKSEFTTSSILCKF